MLYHKPNTTQLPNSLSLAKGDIHLWQFTCYTDQAIDKFIKLLSAEELAKAQRFKFEIDHNRYIIAHGLLRYLLAKYLLCQPDIISFITNEFGKPFIAAPSSHIQFNISHSHQAFLFAFSHQTIGVDVEYMRTSINHLEIAERFFTADEYHQLTHLANEQQRGFFRLWACKEAVVKGLGCGIANGLNQVELNLQQDRDIEIIQINNHEDSAQQWTLYELEGLPDYSAALATQEKNPIIHYQQLSLSDLKLS